MGRTGPVKRGGRVRPAGLMLAGLMFALTVVSAPVGDASATLPGKNGPLLISSFVKENSPNYSTFLFTQRPGGKAKKIAGSREVSTYDGAVSPNGSRIVYSKYPGYQLWLGPAGSPGKAKAITALDPDLNNGDSIWAPDGKSIFYSATYFTEAGVGWHLRRYDLKTKKTRNYKVNQNLDSGLSDVSPNGRLVAYARGDEHDSVIRFIDTKTGKSWNFKFRTSTDSANFSPGGKSIAFVGYVKDDPEVFTARLNGRSAKQLTRGGRISFGPVYSPDGRQIAFVQGKDAYKRIGIITLKTGKTRFLKAPGDYSSIDQWLAQEPGGQGLEND